ncbi:hypothetical protein BLA24_08020 [Streptomyces cinnamoneus]|uniref:Uncharacterized protein n=1 Tax=Streptomyces cinnamoneus TaxID=53446 RepID=A0A2G1XME2_STRCJ|nr:hypothetical protein [Streptomyces cinnamoneus]PHQ52383.1 hypothetical protein BLA24_08020 [Streptomyces cinnamoneus]PPT11585.1 hypothetical protein CYQ11_00455 [Streptomyces cinnamoneus]
MSSMRSRVAAVMLAVAAGGAVLGQASTAMADDHHRHGHDDGLGPLPIAIVSPAPGKITKERKITDTYTYDAKGGSSSSSQEQPPPSSSPSQPEPGPVTALKDTANSAAQAVTSGAGATVDAAAK